MPSKIPEHYGNVFRQRTLGRRWLPFTDFLRHIGRLRWLIPLGLMLLVIGYEVGPARWIYVRWGFKLHLVAEILLFGTVGPALAYLCLALLERWLDEKDTSDLQAQLLTRANDHVNRGRQISDDALQALFATGVLIAHFKSRRSEFPPDTAIQIEVTEQALDNAIERLRSHLME
jgi:hypothetical protein